MKVVIGLLVSLVFFPALTIAQKSETFDIFTFKTPKGWQKEVQQNAVQLGVEDSNGGICLVTVFKSMPGSADSKVNFDSSWESIVKEVVTVSGEPQMNESAEENGWTAQSGIAPYESDGKKGVVMLVTLSGNRKIVNILILTNSLAFQPQITEFLGSLVLPKVEAEKVETNTNQTTAPPAANQTDSRLIGRWTSANSVTPLYADPVSWGISGYTKNRYDFRADGSYVYTGRSFYDSYQNIIIVKETGTYTVNGNQITISPNKSVIESYTKRNGADELGNLVKSQNRELETVTYQFTFHYFSGIQIWNLILQASNPTQRDGQFSTFTLFPNAWYFDQRFNNTDLTSARGN